MSRPPTPKPVPGEFWLGEKDVVYRIVAAPKEGSFVLGELIHHLSPEEFRTYSPGPYTLRFPGPWVYLGNNIEHNVCAGCDKRWVGPLAYLCEKCR